VSAEPVGFWVLAVVLVASSLAVVLTPNLFHAVIYLAVALVTTGVVFLFLQSPFLFGVQLLLYAGGVVTIVVFAIMLTERLVGDRITQTSRFVVNGAIVSAAFFVAVVGFLAQPPAPVVGAAIQGQPSSTPALTAPGGPAVLAAPSPPPAAAGSPAPTIAAPSPPPTPAPLDVADQVAGLGRALTGPFAVPLQLLGVLLVAGLMGAVYFAREDD
jgi:NADH:ubiquinone oxidoreductase subunit 6 (subunit J)